METNKMYSLLIESSEQVEMLTENTEQGRNIYLEGIFAQAEVVNGNGRFYPAEVLRESITKYIDEYVQKRRALGELNHPEYPFPDPDKAAIRITEMRMEGNNVYGKALVLNTPKGQTVKGLLEGGFAMGVSTRALGSIKEKNGVKHVQRGLVTTAVDCVDNPSAPDAYPNVLSEAKKWMLTESGIWMQKEQETIVEFNEQLFLEKLEDFIKGLKK